MPSLSTKGARAESKIDDSERSAARSERGVSEYSMRDVYTSAYMRLVLQNDVCGVRRALIRLRAWASIGMQ